MKRALLIATGTIGGLGAVLAVTPPQFTSTESSPMALPGSATTPSVPGTSTPSATASTSATTKGSTTKPSAKTSAATVATQAPAANTPAATPAQATNAVTGTFTGDAVNVKYGNVQVKITVVNGKITDAQAVQAPSGKNDRWTQKAVPVLRQQTLKAQSAQITGASGASYTSYGWYTSLTSALAKAGM